MSTETTRRKTQRRIAIHAGAGFVPGIDAVVKGAALAAANLGWEMVGIRDGLDGLLHPERFDAGGLITLGPPLTENLDPAASRILGQSPQVDPFHVRQINDDEMVEEVDMSDVVLQRLEDEGIDTLISIVGDRGLSILYKLYRKGLQGVCVPRSIENDISATQVSFGFNTALSFTIEMLDKARQASQSARKLAVVEVMGKRSGWLALQAGIAAGADAVLIPEIPVDLATVANKLKQKLAPGRPCGLVVVAEGASFLESSPSMAETESPNSLRASLSPLAANESSRYTIRRQGYAADKVASSLQVQLAEETYPLVLGDWARGGAPTAVDRQLGLAYGAGAVQAIESDRFGVMVGFAPPEIRFVPLADAINQVRIVPDDSMFVRVARSLDICLGRES